MLIHRINALLAEINEPPLLNSFIELAPLFVQAELAAPFRAIALHQLQFSYNERAMNVREQAQSNGFADIRIGGVLYERVTFQEFLDGMKCDGEWGTDDLAGILGEALGVTVHLLNGNPPYDLYNAGMNAPVINLTNKNNAHWTFSGRPTCGDGNCLFNAFALGLQDLIRKEKGYVPKPSLEDAQQRNNTSNVPVNEYPVLVKPVNKSRYLAFPIGIVVIVAALAITFLSGGAGLLPMVILGAGLLLGCMLFDYYFGTESGKRGSVPVGSQHTMKEGLGSEKPDVKPMKKNEHARAYRGASKPTTADSQQPISQNRYGMWRGSMKTQEKKEQKYGVDDTELRKKKP